MNFKIKLFTKGILLAFCLVLVGGLPTTAETFNNFEVSPLGTATIQTYIDSLVVSDMISGTPETDGIRVSMPSGYGGLEIGIYHFDPSNSLPVGASIQSVSTRVIDGIPDQFAASETSTKTGDNEWELAFNLGSDNIRIEAYLGDVLVFEGDCISSKNPVPH